MPEAPDHEEHKGEDVGGEEHGLGRAHRPSQMPAPHEGGGEHGGAGEDEWDAAALHSEEEEG
ncbi:MAG: hypothetical protein EXR47_06115 [Dehalococcoidia bacterium]|nr:hypothetical protein [Dehalococcoidia bacterium]